MASTVLKQVVRRELHSPRTVATVLVLVVFISGALYASAEILLHIVEADPLFVSPRNALTWLARLPVEQESSLSVVGGVLCAMLGALLVWLSLAPGRRERMQIRHPVYAVVVDNVVIASAVAEHVRREMGLRRGSVDVRIGKRRAHISARAELSQHLEVGEVRRAAESAILSCGLSRRLNVRAQVLRRNTGGRK